MLLTERNMKQFILIFLTIVFCLPTIANGQSRYAVTPAYDGFEEAQARTQKLKEARYQTKVDKNRTRYEDRMEQLNQAYLDAKTSAEITVDEATGITTITWGDGAMYRGQTYYGEIKGIGTMVYPDGSKYCGQWERDLPNGYGTMLYPDGLAYSANFVNGLPHGKGVVEDADGNKFSARWVYGKLKEKSLKPYKEEK